MFRGWKGIALAGVTGAALFAGAVFYAVHRPPKPEGFSGLTFAPLTPAAAYRTPMLGLGGAQVFAVADDSPADKAGIKPDEVVAAIDGTRVTSARQAATMIREAKAGDHVTLTVFDITQGEVKPRAVSLTFEDEPVPKKKFSVHPPRTLAKEYFYPPFPAANASWSKRLLRGPTIRPQMLTGLGAGQCNGFAPEEWRVAAHAPDNSLFHVMAEDGFAHAIYKSGALNGQTPDTFLTAFLENTFGAQTVLTPPQERPFGFAVRDFGNRKGGAGFVLYRVNGNRIALWLAAVPGGDVAWAKPLVGAVALSMRISTRCIQGQCGETDLAATYLTVLRLGFVHNLKGETFLVRPQRDYWQNGAEGPGFYHQIGGENEKLLPGRIN